MAKKRNENNKDSSFEEALKGLEDIVQRLETGDLTLDESLALYEDGVRLTRLCTQQLDQAEKRIEILTRDADGAVKASEGNPADFERSQAIGDGEEET